MLGDGIVSFGTPVVADSCTNEKASPKIVCETPTFAVDVGDGRHELDVAVGVVERTFILSSAVVTPSSA